ncbi:hypothetical protein A6K26_006565 [Gammaproteobacteria bacterium 2W06]|nr:hypothetical protein A6K26_006565 [Gammaproteobacteria bacterium 2W06]
MNSKAKYFLFFLLGLIPLFFLGIAIYYFIIINPVNGFIGSILVGFLIVWFLYVLISVPGELKGLAMVLGSKNPDEVIDFLQGERKRRRL